MNSLKTTFFGIAFQFVLHGSRLDEAVGITGQDKCGRITAQHALTEINGIIRQRYNSNRGIAFWFADNDLCFCFPFALQITKSLHRCVYLDCFFLYGYILPPQRTNFPNSYTGEQSKKHSEFTFIDIFEQIFYETGLFFHRQNPHFVFRNLWIDDLNHR